MQYTLSNDNFEVIVDSKGCEIVSVIRKSDNKQYIWSGQPDIWKRHTPVLFPLVGRYKNDTSIYEGKEYHMTQHGFARDMEFSLVMKDNSAVVMKLESDENTKAVYPFDFELKITHRLADNNVITIWEVVNKDNKEMYFSIGGHPAFVCGENAIGAQVRFETKENGIQYHLLSKDGLVQPDIHYMPITNKNVTLTENFFDKDAYIIENNDIKCVSLCKDCKPVVEVIFDTPVFGLWSSAGKGVPFVCIEPWYGRADAVDFNCRLTDREWGNKLAIVKNKRSKHLGSTFLQELKNIAVNDDRLLMLEVENPDYADEGAAKDYMIKRIGFYKKNGMKLSNTSCYFLGNEYRILYAGDEVEDDYMDEITDTVYRDFFGDQFVDMNVRFH